MLRLTWIGHSTVLLETGGASLLTDPMLRRRVGLLQHVSGPSTRGLDAVDAILLSHLHYDHLDVASLRRLGVETRVLVPVGGGALLRRRGFRDVIEVDVGDEVVVGDATIRATPAEHDGRRTRLLTKGPALGYLVTGSSRVYFAGDTDLFDAMRELAPSLDVALLPIAGWGPRLPRGHLDPQRAAQALTLLHPRIAIPIHWGTYRRIGVAQEPRELREPADRFAQLGAELAPDVEIRVLPVGGNLELRNEIGVEA